MPKIICCQKCAYGLTDTGPCPCCDGGLHFMQCPTCSGVPLEQIPPIIMLTCSRCGTYYNNTWTEREGCPACQYIVSYPWAFLETDEYKRERDENYHAARRQSFNATIPTLTPQAIDPAEFQAIIMDVCCNAWLDEQARSYVESLICHILHLDPTQQLPTSYEQEPTP